MGTIPVPGRTKRRPNRRGEAPLSVALDPAAAARAESPGRGRGPMMAAKPAGRDAGGPAAGTPVGVVAAGHRNKPDMGAAVARRRFDREGVHALLDVPFTRIALAAPTTARGHDRAVTAAPKRSRGLWNDDRPNHGRPVAPGPAVGAFRPPADGGHPTAAEA